MDDLRCATCGARLLGALPGRLCAACLLALAFAEGDEPSEPAPPEAPSRPYRVVTVLAASAGGTRYLAQDRGSHAFVTLRVTAGASVPGMTPAAFDARLTALRELRHPVIARVLDGWVRAGDYCVVAEYLPGRAVEQCADLSAADAFRVFDETCDALSAAHARGVVHGCLDASSVVLVAAPGGLAPRLTGLDVCEWPPVLARDIAGLGRLLAVLADRAALPRAVGALAARAAGAEAASVFPNVESLRAAVAALSAQKR